MYVYFTDTWNGRLNTLSAQIAQFDFGHDDQIIALRVYQNNEDGEACFFGDKLTFVSGNTNVRYEDECIAIDFVARERKATTTWDCNVDLDEDEQIVGVEILFSPLGRLPDRGLDYVLKWRASVETE